MSSIKLTAIKKEDLEQLFSEEETAEDILELIWPQLEEAFNKTLDEVDEKIDEVKEYAEGLDENLIQTLDELDEELSSSNETNTNRFEDMKKTLVEAIDKSKSDFKGVIKDIEEQIVSEANIRGRDVEDLNLAIKNRAETLVKSFEDKYKVFDKDVTSLRQFITDVNNVTEENKILLKEEIDKGFKKTKETIDELRKDVFQKSKGGGNMNRNISIGGNSSVLSRYTDINLKSGSNMSITYANNNTTKNLDVTFTSTGGGGSFSVQVPTGTVNGINTSFTFATEPTIIVLDNSNMMNKVSSDTTVNWIGTTDVVLNQAPNFNIYGF